MQWRERSRSRFVSEMTSAGSGPGPVCGVAFARGWPGAGSESTSCAPPAATTGATVATGGGAGAAGGGIGADDAPQPKSAVAAANRRVLVVFMLAGRRD